MERIKRHRYSFDDKLKVIKLYEQGLSSPLISRRLGFSESNVREWLARYRVQGLAGLERRSWGHYTPAVKAQVVHDILDNFLSYDGASHKHGVSSSAASTWTRLVMESGYESLKEQKPRGRPPKAMGRPKKKAPQTEVEKLQAELEYLRAENAYLKKLRALVEERVARESGRSPKPSKN